jgi:hypothetical protein
VGNCLTDHRIVPFRCEGNGGARTKDRELRVIL